MQTRTYQLKTRFFWSTEPSSGTSHQGILKSSPRVCLVMSSSVDESMRLTSDSRNQHSKGVSLATPRANEAIAMQTAASSAITIDLACYGTIWPTSVTEQLMPCMDCLRSCETYELFVSLFSSCLVRFRIYSYFSFKVSSLMVDIRICSGKEVCSVNVNKILK